MRKLVPLFALALVACKGQPSSLDRDPDAGVATHALEEARRLAVTIPAWHAALHASEPLVADGGAFMTRGFADAMGGLPAFGAQLPSHADGAIAVRAGDASVTLHLAGATSATGTLVDGAVVYEAADLVIGAAPGRVESFMLLRDEHARTTFTYDVDLVGLHAETRDGSIYLLDADARARIRIPEAFAVDARGKRRAATTKLEGRTLTVTLDRSGLELPILLDPALEQVTWTDVGLKIPSWPPPGTTSPPRIAYPADLPRVSGVIRNSPTVAYLWGGTFIAGSYSGYAKDYRTQLYEWNGSAWVASTNGNFGDSLRFDSTEPGFDRLSDVTWDSVRNKMVLFGAGTFGGGAVHLGVYEWTAATGWVKVCADGPGCYDSAPPWQYEVAAGFAFGKSVVVTASGSYYWDPAAGLLKPFSGGSTFARTGTSLAFDVARNRLVAYGGSAGESDTWESDGTTWTKVLATGPSSRKHSTLVYHPGHKRVYLWSSDQSSGGTWVWNGSTWTAVTLDGAGPPPRANAAFGWDPKSGRLMLFGGGDLGGSAPTDNCWYNPYSTPYDNNYDFRGCCRIDTWTGQTFGGACSVSGDCETGETCVDGVCCKTSCSGSCQRCDAPGSVGKCVAVTGAIDPDTCTGASACDATGVCRKNAGQTCALGTECLTGNCADGYCCDTACPGACESCNQAGKLGTCSPVPAGSTGKGCGLYACGGASGSCSTTCTTDSGCAPVAYCNASGACVTQLAKGGACTRNRECASGSCVDGVCCDSACGGTCDVCSAALGATANGTCTVLPKTASPPACGAARCSGTSAACGSTCATDADCSATGYCNAGTCATKRKQGESCDRATQCDSGLSCADGVCCNEACTGACRACSALNKQSGDKSGECGPAKEGTNPGTRCSKSAVSTCGTTGLCDAAGSCAIYAAGTPCGPSGTTTCDGDSVKGQTCDGLGTCALDSAGTPCTPGKCDAGACKLSCTTDADCAAEGYCNAGTCKKKGALGDKCAIDAQCASSTCADGVCCNARCDGACEACDQTGTVGTCTAIVGKPHLGHPACAAGDPGNPCSGAACDGVERTSCAKKSGPEVSCRASSCEADVETLPGSCDGSGTCPAAVTRPCQPYTCGEGKCKTSCANDADCKSGFVCNVASSACVAADKCAGSVVTRVDGTTQDCAPYNCESSGKCKTTCSSTADCVNPNICTDGACVEPTPADTGDSGGCAFSAPRGTSFAGLAFAIALALRRARSRRCAR